MAEGALSSPKYPQTQYNLNVDTKIGLVTTNIFRRETILKVLKISSLNKALELMVFVKICKF